MVGMLVDQTRLRLTLFALCCPIAHQMNAFHTVELDLNHHFTLTKPLWDSQHLDRLEEACRPGRDVSVVLPRFPLHSMLG